MNGQQVLSSTESAAILEEIRSHRYAVTPDGEGFVRNNPAHGWHVRHAADGWTTLSAEGRSEDARTASTIRLKFSGVGYDGAALVPRNHAPAQISAAGAEVAYRWDDNLREWWVNSPAGLEQWFKLQQPPASSVEGQPLRVEIDFRTALALELTAPGPDQRLVLSGPATRIHYDKLKVWDAAGTPLPAEMQLDGSTLALVVDDTDADYPLTIDPTFQQAYLKADNADAFDQFGDAVAVSGDTAIVGALVEDSAATTVNGDATDNSADSAGAAYVFTRDGSGSWTQQAYLKASNAEDGDAFGNAVAISGDTAVVGAWLEDSAATTVNGDQTDNSDTFRGAAYVFVRDGSGNWSQQAYLKASSPDTDRFAYSVAVDGNTAVVGSYNDASGNGGGAAYVFTRDGTGTWSEQAQVIGANTEPGDRFGWSVAVDADTLLVGAMWEGSNAVGVGGDEANNDAARSGAAYVFGRSGGTWTQRAYLKASNTGVLDEFGYAVDLDGDIAVIGAREEDSGSTGVNGDGADNTASNSGAAYIFARDDAGNWSESAYLKASNTDADDEFGYSVAVSGSTVAVAGWLEDGGGNGVDPADDNALQNAGALYVFAPDGTGSWEQIHYLKTAVSDEFDSLGRSLSLSGTTLLAGAIGDDSGIVGDPDDNSATNAGAAYVFELDGVAAPAPEFSVGGTVTGLTGAGLVLQNNGGDDLAIAADGAFTFSATLPDGSSYAVTVLSQPAGQSCTVANGSGTISSASVDNVAVTCTDDPVATFTIGGEVSGLVGAGLRLQNNGGDDLPVSGNGPFEFATALADGSAFSVSVADAPVGQACSVSNGDGVLSGADVTDVAVACDSTGDATVAGPAGNIIASVVGDSPGCTLDAVSVPAPPLGGPAGIELPYGVVDFAAQGCSGSALTIELVFPGTVDGLDYWKFIGGEWQVLPDAVLGGNVVTLTIADNGPFDADPAVGRVADPGGPGSAAAAESIPVLPRGAQVFLALLLLFAGYRLQAVRRVTRG